MSNSALAAQLPVQEDLIFTDRDGKRARKLEKHQGKLLKKMIFLNHFLEADEKILLVSKATSPYSLWEFFLTGQLLVLLKQCYVVFTDRRILHVPLTAGLSGKFRHSIAEIRYADCESIDNEGIFSAVNVKYRSGTVEKFRNFQYPDRRKLKNFLEQLPRRGEPSARERVHLCPVCSAALASNKEPCPSCGLRFKSMSRGRVFSWVFPGGGYFYTGHGFLGFIDAATEVILIACTIGFSVAAMSDSSQTPLAIFFVLVLAAEKWVTVYHTSHFVKEFIPANRSDMRSKLIARQAENK